MKKSYEQIVAQYKEADFVDRLILILQFPELELTFKEIDDQCGSDHVLSRWPAIKDTLLTSMESIFH